MPVSPVVLLGASTTLKPLRCMIALLPWIHYTRQDKIGNEKKVLTYQTTFSTTIVNSEEWHLQFSEISDLSTQSYILTFGTNDATNVTHIYHVWFYDSKWLKIPDKLFCSLFICTALFFSYLLKQYFVF